jgi:endogenous inhibitor of DNA gyrase (YacG/DUF329 family)
MRAMPDPKTARPCPICGKPVQPRFRPFCSARCADVDLGRWFTEGYATPGGPPAEPEDDGPG